MNSHDKLREAYHDAVAFSRAVGNKDYDAAQILWNMQNNKLSIAMPQATIVNSLVHRLQAELDISEEEIWASIVEAVDEMEFPDNGEDSEDGE